MASYCYSFTISQIYHFLGSGISCRCFHFSDSDAKLNVYDGVVVNATTSTDGCYY